MCSCYTSEESKPVYKRGWKSTSSKSHLKINKKYIKYQKNKNKQTWLRSYLFKLFQKEKKIQL